MDKLIGKHRCTGQKRTSNNRSRGKSVLKEVVLFIFLLFLSGCRQTLISVSPTSPKQGDRVFVTVDNKERGDVERVDLTVAGHTTSTTVVPHTVTLDTCKDTGTYMTELTATAVTTYDDGETGTITRSYDLTVGLDSIEDADNQYSVYVAHDGDDDAEDLMVDMANAFIDEFGALSLSQYLWSEARFYTNQCISYANAADLILSFGHGNHHIYNSIDLSRTHYGNFAPCRQNGDAEYLAFASCQSLSMENSGGNPWDYFWGNTHATRLDRRPFSGLHMVMGFRTNFHVKKILWWSDGEDFLEAFAENLDSGDKVVDAWQEAVGDELDFDDGNNRGTVFYLNEYKDDVISSRKDDYIYGNTKYGIGFDYWE